MIENQGLIDDSYKELWGTYSKAHPGYSKDKQLLLAEINRIGARRDVLLNKQSDRVKAALIKQLVIYDPVQHPKQELDDFALGIYNTLEEIMDAEKLEQRKIFEDAGTFSTQPLHLRAPYVELQDDDMTKFMPSSNLKIEVHAPINRMDRSSFEVAIEGLKIAIANPEVEHIIVPVGPVHWRGVYLSKPSTKSPNYRLELFDPYGPQGTYTIDEVVLELLEAAGVNEKQIVIVRTGPEVEQEDGYACGDYTCAYSHKKMRDFGAAKGSYNEDLAGPVLENGNKNNQMRQAFCQLSAGKLLEMGAAVPDEDGDVFFDVLPASPVPGEAYFPAPNESQAQDIKKRKPELVPVDEALEELGKKMGQLDDGSALKSALATTLTQVNALCDLYQTDKLELGEFKHQIHSMLSNEEVNPELKTINTHRGWKEVLYNILGLGIFQLLYSVKVGHLTLFHPLTNSAELIHNLDETVEAINPDKEQWSPD